MSQRDHDLMESVAADEAISPPASPPPRDSMEDADPSLTRKRPRLDSGSKDALAMTANTAPTTNPSAPPSEQQVEMTIRSQPPSSSLPMAAAGGVNGAAAPTAPESTIPGAESSPTGEESTPPSAGSPPVVAVDETDDADGLADSPAPGAIQFEYDADTYFQQFPYANQSSCLQAVVNIAQHFQQVPPLDGTILPQIKLWLDSIPSRPSQWRSFFLDRAIFWEEFAGLVHRVLMRRSHFGDQFCDDGQAEDEIFSDFFGAYLRLCARLLQIDAETLSQSPSDRSHVLPLLCQKHLRHLNIILREEKGPIFHLLSKEYGTNVTKMGRDLFCNFVRADGVKHLFSFASELCGKLPMASQNWVAIWITQITVAIGSYTITLDDLNRSQYYREALMFFRQYNEDLQVPSKVADIGVTRDLINAFSNLLFELCNWDPTLAAEIIDEFLDFRDPGSPVSDSSPQDVASESRRDSYLEDPMFFPALITNAWKFKLLRKYVVKGRMELRVMSIGTMDNALVEIWKELNVSERGIEHPVMQYLADFLLHEHVVDYIISVDSHPQLISRSGNIVGFLVVTHRYSNAQTDAIWKTVSNSPDPRVVSATMTMLRGIFSLMDCPDQLYLCTKLYELPIESYNLDILRFLRELTPKLQARYLDWSDTDPTSRPWNVCIRVLQDTSPCRDSTKLSNSLHYEAYEQLRSVSAFVAPDERHQIYRECAAQIANRSAKATGSVRAIFGLAWTASFHDAAFFKENLDVTRNILEETCAFVETERDIGFNTPQAMALQYRLELLSLLIYRATEAIPVNLYQDIWDHLVGKYAQTNLLRDLAWSKFLDAVQHKPDNNFCKQLISIYVPSLKPEYYTPGMFNFVAAYKFPITRRVVATQDGEKELLQIRGGDLLWSMILAAPPDTIEDRAARLLAARYLETDIDQGVTLEEVEAAHVALVDRCTQEVLAAYKTLRSVPARQSESSDQMDVVLPDTVRQEKERRIGRIILFVKLLLMSIRTKPEFNRTRRSDSKVDPLDIELPEGETIEIKYQAQQNEKQSIIMGSENTLQDLYRRICHATGFSKVNLFSKGQRVNTLEKADQKIANLDLAGHLLLVQKAPGSETTQPVADRNGSCSVFEAAILNHFEDLFGCMDAEDYISEVLYDFLTYFPFRERIAESVISGTATADDLFPPSRLFQAKYAAFALQFKLREQLRRGTLDYTFLGNAVRLLDKAILNTALISESMSGHNEIHLAGVLVSALLEFLKERPPPEVSSTYFSDEHGLVERLLHLLKVALKPGFDGKGVIVQSYATILEASLHSRGVWEAFMSNTIVPALHREVLLADRRKSLRELIAQAIASVCGGGLPSSSPLTEADAAARFWAILVSILPEAIQYGSQSEQLFALAELVFRKHDENSRDEASLRSYLTTWSGLLLNYRHEEFVGRDETDFVVLGLTKLLLSCVPSLKSFKKPLNAGALVEKIWNKYLFVPRIIEIEDESSDLPLPVLESKTRKELYDLVLSLAEDRISYGTLLGLAEGLVVDEATMALRGFSVDRANEIRSATGYVGLFNPRAICYMNSLLTQLFMNVNFRKFMLGLDVADAGASQRLLHETQKLFAQMQNSFRKAADPRDFAACVRVPEGVPIDINVQMDADEFYNLLFDQWEGQMLSPETKQRFRSFYGGQTVNQIKSKECEHVSERVESFFVVQCDVQGKTNLHESLQSFVEGDVMEGDNKYKCESCGGKLVDAVKRTCLKDVPDNLIFHLKRFDFDLVELRRAKINDHFDFPTCIDVSHFKVDYLSDPSKPREEDIFELVGVLVHQGTSENGHYYSYIRERPCPSGSMTNWVEFNDRDVDAFDHSNIPFHAFGGLYDEQFPRQLKQFSAYMLFYQRRSAIEKDHGEYIRSPHSGVVKVPVPAHLDKDIRLDNENLIQEYSLYDPYHTKFVRQILTNLRTINHGTCSEDHQQEAQALHIVLEHLCQTLFRVRTAENFEEALLQLRKTVLSCPSCCHIALKWLATQEYALVNMLLQCLHMKVRSQTRAFLIDGLRYLRDKDPALYGIDSDTDMETGSITPTDGVLVDIVQRLRFVAEESYIASRGWDDFYLTLCQLSDLGSVETAVLLNHNLLEFCLHVFCMHAVPSFRMHEPDLWRLVEKKKRIYNRMVEFVYTLLSKMDISLPIVQDPRRIDRLERYDRITSKFPLSRDEKYLLHLWHEDNRAFAALDRMIEYFDPTKTEVFYPGKILQWMLLSREPRIQQLMYYTVFEGVHQLTPPFSDPYVRAALPYCEACPEASYVEQVIEAVGKSGARLRDQGGEVHIQFFSGLLTAENDSVFEERHPDFFYDYCLILSRKVAIPLLLYDDDGVRRATHNYLTELFTKYKDDELATEETLRYKFRAVRSLAQEMIPKIAEEHQNTTSRTYMQPMIAICHLFIQLLFMLSNSEDPTMEQFKSVNDTATIQAYHIEVDARLRAWPLDDGTPISTGAEAYEHSDYGSESDEGPDILDM